MLSRLTTSLRQRPFSTKGTDDLQLSNSSSSDGDKLCDDNKVDHDDELKGDKSLDSEAPHARISIEDDFTAIVSEPSEARDGSKRERDVWSVDQDKVPKQTTVSKGALAVGGVLVAGGTGLVGYNNMSFLIDLGTDLNVLGGSAMVIAQNMQATICPNPAN